MSIERYKAKIRKLLALAQSDNEHEAARAKEQAKKLMAKFNIDVAECEIAEINATFIIPRKNLKRYEGFVLTSVTSISGTEAFVMGNYNGKQWRSVPMFMGAQHKAEMAAYCYDLLMAQCEHQRKSIKKKHSALSANDLDNYCEGWALTAAKKIIHVFGKQDTDSKTTQASNAYKEREKCGKAKTRKAKTSGNNDLDESLISIGMRDGSKANVNVPVNAPEQQGLIA